MLKKIQAWTGVIFVGFLSVHLLNLWLASLGSTVYDGFQRSVQTVYQFPPVEVALLAALAVHIVVGLVRIFSEPKRQLNLRAKLHRYAGFFLVFVIVGHVLAVRGSSWFFDIWPGFAGIAFSLDFAPGYFYPYYFLLGLTGFYHGLNGLSIALARLGVKWQISQSALYPVTAAVGVLTLTALLGLGGIWTDVGDVYDNDFARKALELLGTVETSSGTAP